MKNIVIYHEVKRNVACPDGFAAAWVANKYLSNAILIGCVYGDLIPDSIEDGDNVTIVDFSFSKQQLESLLERNCKILVLDHHKTAWDNLKDLSKQINAQFDMEQCGATMAWNHFFPIDPMPVFLEYIRDRDLWLHQLSHTHEIHAALSSIGQSFALYDMIAPLDKADLQAVFGNFGKKIIIDKEEKIKKIVQRVERILISDIFFVPAIILSADEDALTSDICAYMYTTIYPSEPFVCCINSNGAYSLRSNRDGSNFDVGSLAKQLGGGGHRNAAGFKI